MPVLQQFDPLTAAAQAVGDYQEKRRSAALQATAQRMAQEKQSADIARQQAQTTNEQRAGDLAQQKFGLEQRDFSHRSAEDVVHDAQADRAAALAEKKEASDELFRAREDALAEAVAENAKTKNDQEFKAKMAQITAQYTLGLKKLDNATTVAQIRAAATEGAASIRAAATVEAAQIHATVTARGQDIQHNDRVAGRKTTERGQDLAHNDRVAGQDKTRKAHLATAVLRLQTQSKGAIKPPTDDPHFSATLEDFSKASPQQRDKILALPGLPASTRQYLQAIGPVLLNLGE